ncbi:MAG: DUF1015 domain-containing protein [Phycisphaerae bacterium]
MAVVDGFCGIRYSLKNGADISDRIAPPYDVVVTDEAKAKLLAKSPFNIIAIDMPHTPPKQAGPEQVYDLAGLQLFHWIKEGVFLRDREPAIYVYQQRFSHQNRNYTRRGFIARLKLEEFGTGSVFPHEQTYGGPKEDRLMLTKFTKSNMSQVFCLFDDDTNEITETLYTKLPTEPTYRGAIEDVVNEVWVVTDHELIKWVAAKMADRKIFIADGHHRYSTSLMYRDLLSKQGKLTPNHPANFVGCMFVSMSEPGLVILPTHRAIRDLPGLTLDELSGLLSEKFAVRWVSKQEEISEPDFGFIYQNDNRMLVAQPKDVERILDDQAEKHVPAWRKLPVAILHSYLLDRIIYPKWLKTEKPSIEYFHLAGEVVDFVDNCPSSLGVLVPPTPIEAVKQISLAGELMPQKSTFFYPKLATGLVINPLFI